MKFTVALFTYATVQLVSAGTLPVDFLPTMTSLGTSQSGGLASSQSTEYSTRANPIKFDNVSEANWPEIKHSSPYIDAVNNVEGENSNQFEKRRGGHGAGHGGSGGGGGGGGGGNSTSAATKLSNPFGILPRVKHYATDLYQNGWHTK
ncbi:hypothetical protein H4R33_000282 [Dimargaris cristalligena]|nr:hypothetical protein H4R33_000282 [Dimargaris cristalligena]